MIQDIALHLNSATFNTQDLVKQFPPVQERQNISNELWVSRLDNQLAKTILDLCELRSVGIPTPVRQYGHLYGLCSRRSPR
jgi:hypothetical protein